MRCAFRCAPRGVHEGAATRRAGLLRLPRCLRQVILENSKKDIKKVLEVILAEFRVEPRNWILPLLKMIRPLPDQEVRIFNEIRDVSKKDPAILFLAVESMFRFASENAGKLFLHAVRTVHPDSGEVYQDAAVFDESMLFGLGQAVDLSPERLRLEDVRKGLEILKERSPSPLWREAAASNLEGAKTFPIRSPLSF